MMVATDPAYQKMLNDEQGHARKALARGGYASGGRISDAAQDKRDIAKGVHKHERALHPGQPETALARGGRPKAGGARTKVVVNAGADKALDVGKQQGIQQGMRIGAQIGAARGAGPMSGAGMARPGPAPAMPPRPMPAPGGAPGAGPGGPPIAPAAAGMGAKKGGKVHRK
jgi:hypothetical protein